MQPVCMALTLHAHVRRYFSEAASLLPTILNNVLHNFYATAALSTSPFIITEYGRYAPPFLLSCPESGHAYRCTDADFYCKFARQNLHQGRIRVLLSCQKRDEHLRTAHDGVSDGAATA